MAYTKDRDRPIEIYTWALTQAGKPWLLKSVPKSKPSDGSAVHTLQYIGLIQEIDNGGATSLRKYAIGEVTKVVKDGENYELVEVSRDEIW